jgi:hypothetical protein
MNCQDFEKTVLVLARNRLLDAAVCEPSLMHARGCARCAGRLAEERALIIGMRALASEIADQEAPAPLEATLLAAFQKRAATPALPSSPSQSSKWSRRNLAAIAAGFIILMSAVAILWAQSSATTRQREVQAGPSTPSDNLSPEVNAPQVVVETVGRASEQSPRRVHHQRSRTRPVETEVVTEFFPLLEGDDLDSLESGQIVRVELSAAALLAVGLAVDDTRASESVKADLVLGHDGMARAIRFVR